VQKIDDELDLIKVTLNLNFFCKTDKLYSRLFNLQQINQTILNFQSISNQFPINAVCSTKTDQDYERRV